MPGHVYFARGTESGRIKIGFTSKDPIVRLAQLQTGAPERLELAAAFPGTRADEQYAHRCCFEHRIVGEWFACRGRLERFLDRGKFNDAAWREILAAQAEGIGCGDDMLDRGGNLVRLFDDRELEDL